MPYSTLLFYAYAPISSPDDLRIDQYSLCQRLDLRGRILIAAEGINGTLSGSLEATNQYISTVCEAKASDLRGMPGMVPTDFKQMACADHLFPRLQVRVREEIVRSDLPPLTTNQRRGTHISPAHLREILQKEPEAYTLVDVRDDYEHQLGRFEEAHTLPIRYFRDFKAQISNMPPKDKPLITYCTGGIRCEKASAWLLEQGFEKVYQLHGGIIAYGQQTDGAFFEGSCYVFDSRLRYSINRHQPSIIGRCFRCKKETEDMVNCTYLGCHRHVLLCESCVNKHAGRCSSSCDAHL